MHMTKKTLALAMFLLFSLDARAASIHLEDDIACDSREVQQTRVRLTRLIMTTDNEQAKDQATREIVAVTSERCVPLTGIFTIQSRVQGLLKVTTKEGADLWLIE
jgi:hypothetical protein